MFVRSPVRGLRKVDSSMVYQAASSVFDFFQLACIRLMRFACTFSVVLMFDIIV
jgi:hypothetical protein